ncbi:MAG: hypothetical protein AB1744_09615 [Candidatus Zixiibacteriota bacterium]
MVLIVVTDTVMAASALVSYQGRLTDSLGYPAPDSSYEAQFAFYADSTGGSSLWQESASITTQAGLFTHLLGSVTPFPQTLFREHDSLFLQVTIEGGAVMPRTRLTEAPYALVAREARNEPGIAVNINTSLIPLPTGSMTDLVTVTIAIPTDGYIVLHGKCYLLFSGATGPNQALVQIDETAGGGSSFPYYTVAGLSGYVSTETSYFPVYVTRVYYKQKGSYTFRMEGRASHSLPAEAKTWDHVLTAVFYPTSYESVTAIMADPFGFSGAVPIQVSDSSHPDRTGTYYKVDLRDMEHRSSKNQKNKK